MQSSPKNPYSSFKNDKERRLALISRDIRLVLIALFVALGGQAINMDVPRLVATLASYFR